MAESIAKDDAQRASEQPPMGTRDTVKRPVDGGNPFPAFLGGLLLGWLIAGAWGFDLFPEGPRQMQAVRNLKQQVREGEQEIDVLKARVRLLTPAGKTPTRTPTAEELLGALDDKRWAEFAAGVQDLLLSDEPGFDELLKVIHNGTGERFEAFQESGAVFAMGGLADRETEISEFLAYALASDVFRDEQNVREWLFEWGTRFVAGTGDDSPSRSALQQSLDRHLRTGETRIGLVLKSLELLEGKLPLDVAEEILKSPDFDPTDHGFLIKQLEDRGDAGVVKLLKAYIDDRKEKERWLIEEALQVLANIDLPESRQALAGFLHSTDPELRDMAFIEFFAAERQPDKDLEPLVEFLNLPEAGEYPKFRVIHRVHQRSPKLFGVLHEKRERVEDVQVRGRIESLAIPVPASFTDE